MLINLFLFESQKTIKSFTTSMDRGIHGGPAKPTGSVNENLSQCRRMETVGGNKDQKNAGFIFSSSQTFVLDPLC